MAQDKKTLQPLPRWALTAIQGLAFWIGYKRSLYRDYPMSEGALVTELRSLIHANLSDRYRLVCEVGYAKLVKAGVSRPTIIAGKARADLVIEKDVESRQAPGTMISVPFAVMEFKRAGAPAAQIMKDLQRLAALKSVRPSVRVFLLVLSDSARNGKFVTEAGISRGGLHRIDGARGYYKVRRTLKAAPAYTNKEIANYACIVEVFTDKPG
jgi:hypothetical protein